MALLWSTEPDDDFVDDVGELVRCQTVRLLVACCCCCIVVVVVVVVAVLFFCITLPLPLLLAPLLE